MDLTGDSPPDGVCVAEGSGVDEDAAGERKGNGSTNAVCASLNGDAPDHKADKAIAAAVAAVAATDVLVTVQGVEAARQKCVTHSSLELRVPEVPGCVSLQEQRELRWQQSLIAAGLPPWWTVQSVLSIAQPRGQLFRPFFAILSQLLQGGVFPDRSNPAVAHYMPRWRAELQRESAEHEAAVAQERLARIASAVQRAKQVVADCAADVAIARAQDVLARKENVATAVAAATAELLRRQVNASVGLCCRGVVFASMDWFLLSTPARASRS